MNRILKSAYIKKATNGRLYLFFITSLFLVYSSSCSKDNEETTVKDVDGNVYHTVTIGSQVWLIENLRTTHYRNGDIIPDVPDSAAWISLQSGALCLNPSVGTDLPLYGYLYNWYAAADPRGLAPQGWHVPSQAEWNTLINYLGGEEVAGGKVKEAGTSHWISPNTGATNESGFTALPAGGRSEYGEFMETGHEAVWWSTTFDEGSIHYALGPVILNFTSKMRMGTGPIRQGLSVRCIKD